MAVQPLIIFDENGVTVPSKSQIFNYLVELKKEIYGQDIIIQEGTPEYSEIDFMADHFTNLNNGLLALFQSISPNTAVGVALDNIAALSGIIRIVEILSTADVLISGTPGTVINNGVVRDVNDNLWNLPSSVTIDVGGTVTVTATAQESGEISALPNTINIIETAVVGWTSVTNPSAASVGQDTETDGQLRLRRALSTAISSITPVDSLTSFLLAVTDVSDVLIFENDTDTPFTLKGGVSPADDLPAHSIAAVVEGGDTQEIGEAIRLKKTLGCGTFGDTTVQIIGPLGTPQDYKFERPTNLDIYVDIEIDTKASYADTTDDLIRQALVDAINGLSIANDVTLGELINAVYDADPLADGQRTFNVNVLNFGTSASPTQSIPVEVAWNLFAFTDTDFSKITLTKV